MSLCEGHKSLIEGFPSDKLSSQQRESLNSTSLVFSVLGELSMKSLYKGRMASKSELETPMVTFRESSAYLIMAGMHERAIMAFNKNFRHG